MYHLVEGEPFKVYLRREAVGAGLVIRFECKEGMGVLGVRRPGQADPAPVAAFEEEGVDASAVRAGRFVHVLANGQRQSYALSRISAEVAARIPTDRWLELEPQTEYGFRYLVAAEKDLDRTTASVSVTPAGAAKKDEQPTVVSPPRPPLEGSASHEPMGPPPTLAAIPEAALANLTREQAVNLLRSEMGKVHSLQQRVVELDEMLKKSRARERDLMELLGRWSGS